MTICKCVIYSGRVQGVGFRYTSQRLAQGFSVGGYVRNLANGNVELVAEGPEDQVEAFLEAVASRMADYIDHRSVTDAPPGNYRGFHIRH
jgi:acylphosphatase